MKLLYIETSDNDACRRLLDCCDFYNVNPIQLAQGLPFNFYNKFVWVYEAALKLDCEYFIHMDGRDVLFLSNLDDILHRFKTEFPTRKMLFQGETWPEWRGGRVADDYPNKDLTYRYINSGCYISETKYFIKEFFPQYKMWNETGKKYCDEDQTLAEWIYLDNYNKYGEDTPIILDHDCKIFQDVSNINRGYSCNYDLIYKPDSIYNRLTGTYPMVFHGAGHTILSQVEKVFKHKQQEKLNKFFA